MIIRDGTELADYVNPDELTDTDLESFGEENAADFGDPEETPEPYAQLHGKALAEALRNPRNFLAGFDVFHLNQRSRRELECLFELLLHRRDGALVKPVHYGLLLECDYEDYGKAFMEHLNQILHLHGLLEGSPTYLWECEYDPDAMYEDCDISDRCAFRIVRGCQSPPVPDNLSSPSVKKETDQAIQYWEKFWKYEEDILRKNQNLIGVAIVPRTVVRSTWKHRDHLFFRVYGHHIRLDDLPVADIQELTFEQLRNLGLAMDEDFVSGLNGYIQVVYPKADLKIQDFTQDLVNRILTAYYSSASLEPKLTARCVPYYRRPRSFDDIIAKLNGFVGMETVKKAFQEIYYQNQDAGSRKTILRLSMAFLGNPGTGKTSVAQMAADLLYTMGLIQKNKLVTARPADLISPWVGQTAIQTRDICQSAYGGVLFIDEAYTLTYSPENRGISNSANATAQCVDTLLQEMEENADRLVVIFAGYPGPMERFLDSNEGLRSRVTRTVFFPDYTEEELLEIFGRLCAKEQFSLEEDGIEALKARIAYEKSGEHFGNARAVENIFQSVRAKWQESANDERVFTAGQIRATMPEQQSSSIGDMIGLDEIKEQLRKFESRVKYIAAAREKGVRVPPLNLHMLFTGNPGTGKTSVARVIAEDLYKTGVLKTNKCICVEARDLTGNWNDAAKRTEKEIQRAMGGVLFLDEAYALTEYASGSVGREVVATLITAMEKYRGELLVILAGYPENMRAFLNVNPGLTSRIGYTFHFRDYTVRELTDIFLTKMQKCGYLISDGVADKVEKVMEYFHVVPAFGNGRFVDNLIDQTITRRSTREEDDLCRYNEITAGDIPDIKTMLDSLPDGERFRDPAKVTREELRRTAVHETGHALLSLLLEPESKLSTISISQQAYSAGRVEMRRSGGSLTEEQLMNTISIALGGRDAERAVFGTHSTGCASDYALAKSIARDMLEHYAMGPKLGARDIAPLLNQADENAAALLNGHKDALLALSEQLLEERELTDGQIRDCLAKFQKKQAGGTA